MKRILILLILIIIMQPSFAAGSKSYSDDLPTAGRQRSPVALTNLFTDILSWINGVYAGTGDASSANQALISLGNGNLSYTNLIRSNVDLEHTGGNGTTGQALVSNGDGTTEWASVGTLTDADKGDITVATSGTVWTIDNGAVDTDALAANAVTSAKITNGTIATADIANGAVTTEKIAAGNIWNKQCTSADVSVTSASFTDVTGLGFTPSANKIYAIRLFVPYTQTSGAYQNSFTFTTPTGINYLQGRGSGATSTNWVYPESTHVDFGSVTGLDAFLSMDLVLSTGASPSGDLQLRFKSNHASANTTTVNNGACLFYMEIE